MEWPALVLGVLGLVPYVWFLRRFLLYMHTTGVGIAYVVAVFLGSAFLWVTALMGLFMLSILFSASDFKPGAVLFGPLVVGGSVAMGIAMVGESIRAVQARRSN